MASSVSLRRPVEDSWAGRGGVLLVGDQSWRIRVFIGGSALGT